MNFLRRRSFLVFFTAVFGGAFLWSGAAHAAAPLITNVKFKTAGDSPKIAVFFDQGVMRTGGQTATTTSFILSGASSTGASIASVEANMENKIFVLTISSSVKATAVNQWAVAASSSLLNAGLEAATTTAVDLNGKGDGAGPLVRGVFQHATSSLDVMFSEEIDSTTGAATSSYSNLLTAAVDTPGVQSRQVVGEKTFAILTVTASTTLGWGSGNSVDVGSVQDLVGNPMAATSTFTILPAIKISEVRAGSSANNQDEFIELYNFGDVTVDIATTTFFLHIQNGADGNKVLNFLKSRIPDHGYYLVGSQSSYSGSVSLDASYNSSSNDVRTGSGIYISASSTATSTNGLVIDLLGMGTSTIWETTTTPALPADKSYERKASSISTISTMAAGGSEEFKGNSYDSHNSNADFALRNAPQPQNSASQREFPFGGPGANDTGAPQVMGSFPGGMSGEVVATNLEFIGFGFNESLQENTVSTSTVKLFAGADTATNLCSSVQFSNFPAPNSPPGKCVVAGALSSSVTYTFKILAMPTSTAVKDLSNNALSQPANNRGDGSGNYVITFTPSSGGSGTGFTFDKPPVFVQGGSPFNGAVNVSTNIKKVMVIFSDNAATSSINATNLTLKTSAGTLVSLVSVSSTASESKFASNVAILNFNAVLAVNTQYQIGAMGVTDTSARPVSGAVYNFTTGAGADTTGPLVVGKIPNVAAGVSVSAIDVHVMTDDKLDPTSIATSTVKLKESGNEVPGVVKIDPFTGEVVFLATNVFLADTSYTVSVNATGSSPCVKNLSDFCLQDSDGTANDLYEFSFTTGGADATAPSVIFANADQRHVSVSFDEPVKESEAKTLDNYSLVVSGATTTLSSLAGQTILYDAVSRTATIDGLNLQTGASYTVTVSGIHDLSGNLIGAGNSAIGTVLDMGQTGGFIGPGGSMLENPSGAPPQNFSSSTFGFVPQINIRPMSPLVGVSSLYFIDMPISKQVKASGGKIVLTFPSGFDITNAVLDSNGPMAGDANGPGPGVIIPSISVSASARTITVTVSANTRCDTGNVSPCSGDTHDFLHLDVKGILNSSISKDTSSGGYTADVKVMDGTTVLESLTSNPFYLIAGGSNALVVNLSASGATTGTTTVRMFSPLTGPNSSTTSAFGGGIATTTFTSLVDGDYFVFTDSIITLGGTDYIGRAMPTAIRLSGGATTTLSITLDSAASLATTTVSVTGPTGKNIDVFANSADKFVVKTITTNGSAQNVVLRLAAGTWFVGVGPAIPKDTFSGPPPAPDFVMQPPVQIIISGTTVKESSGTPDDGIVVFTLGAANKTISGLVQDALGRALVKAEVFAFSPLGGFGTHGSTDASGKFSLNVGAGTYQVGAFTMGLPPSGEVAVEVKSDGTLVQNGQTVSSVTLKLIKPDYTISGKVVDQDNNAIQGAGVFAYCDPSVSGNTCLGPGDHTGSPTNSDGSYTLYVKNGTWKVGAFLPGFGELPQVSKAILNNSTSGVNFSPSTNTNFNTVAGTVCKDDHASGNSTTCGSGDTKISGAFVRATSAGGSNQGVSGQGGTYSIKVPADSSYTIEAFSPNLGRLKQLASVDVSTSTTGKDFVVGNPNTVIVNVKDSSGNLATTTRLFVDFFDFTNKVGNYIEIKDSVSSSISLPAGSYRIRASLQGQALEVSSVASDIATTTVATSTGILTVDGNETIKITIPTLATVAGTVYSGSAASGNELGDAFVQLANPSAGIFVTAQASSSGAYSVKVPIGTYNILAKKPGYMAQSLVLSITTNTATTTQNLLTSQASFTISGAITINGSAASRAFVKAERAGGGFTSAQTDSTGAYALSVINGNWRVFALAEGYAEVEYGSQPVISGSSQSGVNINLTTKVALASPKVCQITPSQGGDCSDSVNGMGITIPPSALGTGTTAATITVKQTNTRQQTAGTKPVGNGFEFIATDSSGNSISAFNSSVTLEFTQTVTALSATGITTKTKADAVKITLWSETIKDYEVLATTVDYLDSNNDLVSTPSEDLSNVVNIRFKALTTHF